MIRELSFDDDLVSGEKAEPKTLVRSDTLRIDTTAVAMHVLKLCVACEAMFLVLDYHVSYGRLASVGALRRMSNIAREDSVASWFGTTQTLLVALTLWLTFLLVRQHDSSRFQRVGWAVVAGFFSYMAIDDGAMLHERLGTAFKVMQRGAGNSLSFFPSYTWQVTFLPIFVGLGLFMVAFMWRELNSTRQRVLVVGAAGIMAFAVGLDFIEGLDAQHPLNAYTWLASTFELETWTQARFGRPAFEALRHGSKAIEEAMEMLAISVLWFVFLDQLGTAAGRVKIAFGESA
jgi:hypothetical protein